MASKKQRAAARRNIKKAQKALRAKREGKKMRKRAAAPKTHRKTVRRAAKRAAPKRKHRRRKAAAAAPKRKRARRSAKRRSIKRRAAHRRTTSARATKANVIRVPAGQIVVAQVPRKGGGKRKRRRVAAKRRKSPGRRKSGPRRHKGAMENPMTGVELFVGGVTGLMGFLTADAIDRVMATHALGPSVSVPGAFGDTPPTSGDYQGLYNATAICAPMDWKRWLVGALVTGVPLTIGHFISAPTGRAAFQFFGFAAGVRIIGKGAIDAVAMLVQKSETGQRLYDGEMRAAALKSGNGVMPANINLPIAGLGRPQLGAPCACGGKCAKCAQGTGAGYPSMPREIAASAPIAPPPAQAQMQPSAPPPAQSAPPAAPPAPPPAGGTQMPGMMQLTGVPRPSRFGWGYVGTEGPGGP